MAPDRRPSALALMAALGFLCLLAPASVAAGRNIANIPGVQFARALLQGSSFPSCGQAVFLGSSPATCALTPANGRMPIVITAATVASVSFDVVQVRHACMLCMGSNSCTCAMFACMGVSASFECMHA